jgi:hypothetical protein
LNGSFYVSGGGGPYIAYDFNVGAQVKDRERAKFLIRNNLDKTRARILKRYLGQANPQPGTNEAESV